MGRGKLWGITFSESRFILLVIDSARYGESKDYDPVSFPGAPLLPDAKKERRLSSSRRRDKLKSSRAVMSFNSLL